MNPHHHPAGSPQGGQFASKGYDYEPGPTSDPVPSDKVVREFIRERTGKDLGRDDMVRAAGVPDGFRVLDFKLTHDTLVITAEKDFGESGMVRVGREFAFDAKTVINHYLYVDKKLQGGGIGAKILAQEVEESSAAGFEFIQLTAAGAPPAPAGSPFPKNPAEDSNGYYTWARLGFEPVDAAEIGGVNLRRLMTTKEGRELWKAQGQPFTGRFDLRPGSVSRRVLSEYVKAKGF